MAARTRVGVVGTGYLGRFHAEKYARMHDEGIVELVGVADVEIARAQEVVGKLGKGKAFASSLELGEASVDAVSVVVPTHVHHRVAKPLLEQGVDCLVEKPFAVTLAEADDLIATAARLGRVLQVGHLERFNPVMRGLKDKIRDPMFVESHRLAMFGERGTEVDVILDLMIHDLDIILMAVNSEVVDVSAVGVPVLTDKVDIANARLEFANGCVANVTASRVSAKSMRKLRVFQPDTYVSIDFESRECAVARKLPGEGRDGMPKIDHQLRRFAQGDSLEAELRAFVDAVRGRARPGATGREGRRALDLALAVSHRIRAGLK